MSCFLCGLARTHTTPICKNEPCQICTEVTEVDEEINQAVANLRRLLSKQCDILSEHNRVHGTLIHRLPVELKNRIFELLPPPRNEWGVINGTRMHSSSLLTTISVCREWRDVALSNPFLWSTMHVNLGTSNLSSRINDWVLRSQTLPLTLHVDCSNKDLERSRKVLADVMSLCSNRLKSLSLSVPSQVLCGLRHNNFQYHHLTQLRVSSSQNDQPLSLLNPTASPEKIELVGSESFQSLHISWDHLISATIFHLDLEGVTQLFQRASQMTFCRISILPRGPDNSSMPPIIHHRLKTLELHQSLGWGVAPYLLGSFTLPCLQEVEVFEDIHLKLLSALVRRSSCPLTKLTLHLQRVEFPFDEFQPLSGMTDLVVRFWEHSKGDALMRLLLEGHFPDLRHLTLGIQPFEVLWDIGAIPILLDSKRPRPDEPNEGRLHKFIVVEQGRISRFDRMWNSDVGEQLKELGITMREDGFEFF